MAEPVRITRTEPVSNSASSGESASRARIAGAVMIALTRSPSIAGSSASGAKPSVSTSRAPVTSQPPQAWYPGPPDIGTKPPMTSSPVIPIRATNPLAHSSSCCSGRSTSLGVPVLPLVTTSLVTSCGP